MGRLCRDPEIRVTPKGTSICQLSLAVNREWKNEAGEKQEEVLFVDVEAWGKVGDVIAKYFTKGKPIYLEGRLRLDQWEDKTTKEKRSRMKVVLEQFQFIGGKDDAPQESRAPAAAAPKERQQSMENLDEDVPF